SPVRNGPDTGEKVKRRRRALALHLVELGIELGQPFDEGRGELARLDGLEDIVDDL
ncbi:hypothetical protein ILP92_11425, partial [Maribius pontilimi]|nr:hypothetical protein [Palleronia pontilimi]